MCNQEVINKIDNGEAIVLTKGHFWIAVTSMLLTLIIIVVSFAVSYTKLEARVHQTCEKQLNFETDLDTYQKEKSIIQNKLNTIEINLKNLCNHFQVKYIDPDK